MSKADGVFIYVGTYASEVDARTDYDLVKELHSQGAVGTYDAAVITKDDAGKVRVEAGKTLTTEQLGSMNWFVDGVQGKLAP